MTEHDQEAKRKRRKGKKRRKSRRIFHAWSASLVNICTAIAMLVGIFVYVDGKLERQETRQAARMDGLETRMEGLETRMGGLETRMGGLETKMGGLETGMERLEDRIDGYGNQMFAMGKDIGLIKGAILGISPEEPGSQQSGEYQSGAFNALPLLPPAFVVSRAFWEGFTGVSGEKRQLQSGHGKTMLFTVGGQRFLAVTVPAPRFSMSWTQACDPQATQRAFGKGQGFLTWIVPVTRVKVSWPETMEYQAATPATWVGRLWHGPLENPPSPVLIGKPVCP